jgi:DNA-directed RNA polymerase III subunit RPC3
VQSSGEGLRKTEEVESYDFVVKECLLRLRWGRMIAIVQERIGDAVSLVVVCSWRESRGSVRGSDVE